ncbi:MAG: PQQ-binding-like beta-propeller repeat protein, partial [Planctomycetota bacterium JB042]
GAAALDGSAYVLGGYTGRPHDYRTRFQSRAFWRINLRDPSDVELLPNDLRIQSVALVADGGTLVRAGGMTIVDDVTRSTGECARFDPATGEWSAFPALPRPRSSHEAAVIGRTLYLAGGWDLDGDGGAAHWHDDVLAIDLDAPDGGWRSVPQPFRRRALAVAEAGGRLVVLGGMTSDREISSRVDVLDPATGTWSTGPDFPGPGFGVAAVGVDGKVVASGMDGVVHAWAPGEPAWRTVATLVFPRFFHQLVPSSSTEVCAIGGIGREVRPRHVERVPLGPATPRPAEVRRFVVPTADPTPGRSGALLRGHELLLFGKHGTRVDLRTLAVSEVEAPPRGRAPLRTWTSSGGRNAYGIRDGATSLLQLDPEAGTWSEAATLAEAFGACGWHLDGRELWAFGGTDAATRRAGVAVRRASVARPEAGFEDAGIALPRPRSDFAIGALDGRVHLAGGLDADGAPTDTVDVLDLDRLTWSEAPRTPRPRTGGRLVPLGGRLVLIGGNEADAAGDLVPSAAVRTFAPGEDGWTPFLDELEVAGDETHAFPYRGHLLVAAPDPGGAAVRILLVRPPVERPDVERGATSRAPGDRWSEFRGGAGGRSDASGLPTEWSDERGVAWSVDLPGTGQSSPVIDEGRVVVTSVDGEEKERLIVSCLDAADGALVWRRTLDASLRIPLSDMVSQAAPTPAVDGRDVFAFFESGDLVALDGDGEVRWRRALAEEYGPFVGNHGLGGSVALTDEGVVVLVDHDGPSYLLCVDRKTGENRWKVDRTPRISWTTPVVTRGPSGEEVVVSSAGSVEGFDAATGRRTWVLEDVEGNTIPSPTVLGDLVVVGASSGDGTLAFLRPSGDDPRPRIVWRAPRTVACGFGSPLVLDRHVLLVNKSGVLVCLSRDAGRILWKHRLPSATWSSPIAADGRVWLFGTDGETTVATIDDAGPEVVAESRLAVDGKVVGVAAIDGAFFVREPKRLRCLRAAPTVRDETATAGE